MRRLAKKPLLLWSAFIAVHLWLGYVGLTAPTLPWGDVTITYNAWVSSGFNGYWLGIDGPWVYPLLALVPMLGASVFGSGLYGVGWFILAALGNAAVFAVILNSRATKQAGDPVVADNGLRFVAAWWWLGFMLLLGPVGLGRIDTFTVDLVVVGLLFALRRPAIAGVLLALATWVKVWPIALVVAVFVAAKKRMRVAVAAAVTAVGVAIVGLVIGAGANLFSFVTQQTSRGLQIEAPVSTPFMWLAYFYRDKPRDQQLFYDQYSHEILTFQVYGPGGSVVDALTTPMLGVAMVGVLALGLYVMRSGASTTRVLPPMALALVTALILFNKVGSPQFMLWISAPVILGLIWQGKAFRTFAIITALLGGLTQIIYPYLYDWLISLDPGMLTVLTVRNALEVVLLVLAIRALWRARVRRSSSIRVPAEKVVV